MCLLLKLLKEWFGKTYVFADVTFVLHVAVDISMTICYIVECNNGYYGAGCRHDCHCNRGEACDKIQGLCPDNTCAPGWMGDVCEKGA